MDSSMIDLWVVWNMQAPTELRLCVHLAELLLRRHRDSSHFQGASEMTRETNTN